MSLRALAWQSLKSIIATLFLTNYIQDAFANRSSTEGEYFGYYKNGLYSLYTANWCDILSDEADGWWATDTE